MQKSTLCGRQETYYHQKKKKKTAEKTRKPNMLGWNFLKLIWLKSVLHFPDSLKSLSLNFTFLFQIFNLLPC